MQTSPKRIFNGSIFQKISQVENLIIARLEIFIIPDTIRFFGAYKRKPILLTVTEIFLAKGKHLWEFLLKLKDTLKTD